jgi:hypothetical protein
MTPDQFLELPLETLVILGSGYLAYKLAFQGRSQNHKPLDVAFITFAFGIGSKLVFSHIENTVWASTVSLFAALALATLWRAIIVEFILPHLWTLKISNSDGHSTAFDSIRCSQSAETTQLVVRKTDGQMVMCDDLNKYEKVKFGPCIYGEDGSIALYITNYRNSQNDEWEDIEPFDENWGYTISYIPAIQVAEIKVRHVR